MNIKVVRTTAEFEGEFTETTALVEGKDLAPWGGEEGLSIVGARATRVDGVARVTGRARYTQDLYLPGMLHVRMLRSPYPRARVLTVDASRALAHPGVRGVLHRFNAPKAAFRGEETIFRDEVRFAGDEVAAVAADSEEQAADAVRLIDVEYEVLPFVADLEEAMRDGAVRVDSKGNVSESGKLDRGDARRAFAGAKIVVESTYRTSTQIHNSFETHGAVARWDGDELTVWESTQHVFGVRAGLQAALKIPYRDIRVLCDYMGGGFGSKGGAGKYTIVAAMFARQLGKPVRCFLTRDEENLAAGNRSATYQTVKIAARGKKIDAIEHLSWSNSGQGRWVADPTGPTKGLYDIPNVRTRSYKVVTSLGALSSFRAPGYVEGTFALDQAIDELAERMGEDPLALRRRHAARQSDPVTGQRYSLKRLLRCYDIGEKEIGWQHRKPEGTRGSAPHRRRGYGMASQLWGGSGLPPAYATVHLNPDGTAVLRCGTQDIGTGTRTVLAQILAEELGIEVGDVRVELGDTNSQYSPISAGSLTVSSVGPAVRLAAQDARMQLLEAASGLLEVGASELRVEGGKIVSKGRRVPLGEVLGQVDNYTVIGKGSRFPNPEGLSLKTFGAHFAQVEVDIRTGEVIVEHVVAVHDIGRVINPLTAASQVEGGVIQGLGFVLSEERIVDRPTGRVVNGNLEGYKIPTVRDIPKITVKFVDEPDPRANNIGAKGLGEPPIIPLPAAIANAIANAIGVRMRTAPITRQRILDALSLQ
ncbi:MAG: xanthine dehydrogenase family protein molybdopterin-binding subunit [Chloroflexota bacterium]|nr:xanthine dehydrogenase family protein molybdopterin-binding subunit [Chloroflexota bacterium]